MRDLYRSPSSGASLTTGLKQALTERKSDRQPALEARAWPQVESAFVFLAAIGISFEGSG